MNFEIILATNNRHKLQEVREILCPHGITVYGLFDLNLKPKDMEENAPDYYGNALIKAKAVAALTTMPIIADDSGLEVTAMDNKPGIHSARYAEECGGHDKAIQTILQFLSDKQDRSARFVCDIVLVNMEDKPLLFEGIANGKIATEVHGEGGFGYDPIFFSKELGKTFAEASEDEKNKASHRGKALKKLLTYLIINGKARN